MTLTLSSAVVIDDAFGPPTKGTINADDKNNWIEFVSKDADAEVAVRNALFGGNGPDLDDLLSEVTSEHEFMARLWELEQNNALPDAKLSLLFQTVALELQGKACKPLMVVEKLGELCGGADKVRIFCDLDSAEASLAETDIAFIDFYLSDGETEDDAIRRITNAADKLNKPKLVFFMSSRASLEVQHQVRKSIGVKTAFYEVMQKSDISPELLALKISAKCSAFEPNKSLEGLIDTLVDATQEAIKEFQAQSSELEVHDLSLLNLARLKAEGESLPEYLTWLFSETVAAKTRRKALPSALAKKIETDSIGFTGQIEQGLTLFNFFSEVVFGLAVSKKLPMRFGELVRYKATGKHYLILTPACDLQRCEPTKMILCVAAVATAYADYKELSATKLYGKMSSRVRHLYCTNHEDGHPEYTMLEWELNDVATFTVQDLQSENFERIALMNELFAQEVKEEVLRKLGRVGTQIDPPPPLALKAKLQWKKGTDKLSEDTPHDSFISALLTYAEDVEGTKRTTCQAIVLSDEFRYWALEMIRESFADEEIPQKMKNCLETIQMKNPFILKKNFAFVENDLRIKVVKASEVVDIDKGQVEIMLMQPDSTATPFANAHNISTD
ncbi:hypothetical protein RIE95_15300 [Acidithiobacillus thiooxidans]|uniref:hypothetical protein n=1 Tax=Acidithiobacillus thiooxidans TaxID=930 RepID=UPI0028622247|nr:hypothetical protein [Acidithiobacillus thiooxidans]MDR7928330.1 hypothetical protein [Acidithiobacillus thiooxidans]